jgi:SIR2-like domain
VRQSAPSNYGPDIIQQVDWLGRRLHRERRVSVLVGAGLSRNATPNGASLQPLGTWWQLAQELGKRLQLSKEDLERKSVTRIPGEFEAAFGREVLDDAILDVLIDTDYSPSELQIKLMRLPWTDVFTTNYDTLLERAADKVFERRYSVVTSTEDLTSTRQPRIVKLHGSFPSHRPFIVTEEDFRTYPRKFAPFVNLVQQSLIENTLVLIGFSGDDPNFLAWSGWVRDELGEHAPRVVLVTIDLDHASRRYLENRNVNVIDLGAVVPSGSVESRDRRYAQAYSWFIDRLETLKPTSAFDWPGSYDQFRDTSALDQNHNELPDLQTLFPWKPDFAVGDEVFLTNQLKLWQVMRQEYPGWVVCPHIPRTKVLDRMEMFLQGFRHWHHQVPERINLSIAREIVWWCEISLVPLIGHDLEWIQLVWNLYSPFSVENPECFNAENKRDWNWSVIAIEWLEVGLGLLRMARLWGDASSFSTLSGILQPHLYLNPVLERKFEHECLVFSVTRLDLLTIDGILSRWEPDWNDPFWETRRAAILGELGRVEEARELALRALEEIRSRISQRGVDYRRLSEEGWTLHLLQMLDSEAQGSSFGFTAKTPKPPVPTRERFRQLAPDWCDPRDVMNDAFGDIPRKALRSNTRRSESRDSFDPDRWSTNTQLGSNWKDAVKGIAFLETFVQGGLAYHLGILTVRKDDVVSTIEMTWDYMPAESIFCAVRLRHKDFIKKHLTRHGVLALEETPARTIISGLLVTLRQALQIVTGEPDQLAYEPGKRITDAALETGVDTLSRLTLRMTKEELGGFFDLILVMYRLPRVQRWSFLHEPLRVALKRIINTIGQEDFDARFLSLLSLPIPGEPDFQAGQVSESFPEPFDPDWMKQNTLATSASVPPDIFKRFFKLLKNDQHEIRSRAFMRLVKLYQAETFNPQQKREFASAIWANRDASNLPSFMRWYKTAYLDYPVPKGIDLEVLLRQYLLQSAVPFITKPDGGVSYGPDENHHFFQDLFSSLQIDQSRSLKWTNEELESLFDAVNNWWKEDGLQVWQNQGLRDVAHDRVRRAVTRVFDALLPRLTNHSAAIKKRIAVWIQSVESAGVDIVHLEPIKLLFRPAEKERVALALSNALISSDLEQNVVATYGVVRWLTLEATTQIPKCPESLIDGIVLALAYNNRDDGETIWEAFNGSYLFLDRLNETQLGLVIQLLDRVRVFTEINPGISVDSYSPSGVPWSELPILRTRASTLAARIWGNYQAREVEIPEILQTWRSQAMVDLLPEVRRPWIDKIDEIDDF